MIEPTARPQLPEILGEQVQRDERDDEYRRARHHGPRLTSAVHHPAHQDHDPDRLEGGHEQQRNPRDPCPGQLCPVHSAQRGPQPGTRPELGGFLRDRVPDGEGTARQDLGGYDTHVERLLFASAVVLFRTALEARTLTP